MLTVSYSEIGRHGGDLERRDVVDLDCFVSGRVLRNGLDCWFGYGVLAYLPKISSLHCKLLYSELPRAARFCGAHWARSCRSLRSHRPSVQPRSSARTPRTGRAKRRTSLAPARPSSPAGSMTRALHLGLAIHGAGAVAHTLRHHDAVEELAGAIPAPLTRSEPAGRARSGRWPALLSA